MTAESMLRVDFTEIADVRITCANCRAEIVIPVDREIPKTLKCPGCNEMFWGDGHQAIAYKLTHNILTVVKEWQNAKRTDFSLSFSLPHSKA